MPSTVTAHEKGMQFERRVAFLFELHGYAVQRNLDIAGRQFDLLLETPEQLLRHKFLVECKDTSDPVGVEHYDAFNSKLRSARRAFDPSVGGVIVASVDFTKAVKTQSRTDGIHLFTVSDLEKSLIDLHGYVQRLSYTLEHDKVLDWYIQPNLILQESRKIVPAWEVFNDWLSDPETNHLTLLGDYGTGKSTFLKWVALQSARTYQEEVINKGARGRAPILVNLGELPLVTSLQEIADAAFRSHGIRYSSYEAFEYALVSGQILLLLDSFDEMAGRGRPKEILRAFRTMNRSALGKAKIVLSSRTHFFSSGSDVLHLMGGDEPSTIAVGLQSQLMRDIAPRRNFVIAHLRDFDRAQIEQCLDLRCGADAGRVQDTIDSTFKLEELSRRPVLLDMIIRTHEKLINRKGGVTPGYLYHVYTDDWLSQNDWCAALKLGTKAELLQWFAERVSHDPKAQLHHEAIPELIKDWNPQIRTVDADEVDRELRAASFLQRDGEGNYRFSHPSFQDFFMARYLLSAVGRGDVTKWADRFFSTDVYFFLRDLVHTSHGLCEPLLGMLTDDNAPWRARANAAKVVTADAGNPKVKKALVEAFDECEVSRLKNHLITALGYVAGDDACDRLIPVVRRQAADDDSGMLRGNALAALGRIGSPKAVDFVIQVLRCEENATRLKPGELWPLCRAAFDFPDETIAREILREAPVGSGRATQMVDACLRLCGKGLQPDATGYCLRVVKETRNPRLVAKAFLLIPLDIRRRRYRLVLDRLRNEPDPPRWRFLIPALKDLEIPEIGHYLAELVDRFVLRVPPSVFEILAEDYGDVVAERALEWGRRGRPYALRIVVARELARRGTEKDLKVLRDMLAQKERPRLKVEALRMMFESNPEFFAETMHDSWHEELTAGVARMGLELLQDVDPDGALELMLSKGLGHARRGIRIAVCNLLGPIHSARVTDGLLDLLEHDDSQFVRHQSLISLLFEGRDVAPASILQASAAETDEAVLELRRKHLGE